MADGKNSSMNMDENVAGALCYVLWWLTGIIFYLIEKDNKFVKFHAMQSILTFLGFTIIMVVLNAITFWLWFLWWLSVLVFLLSIIAWIILIVKAYQGEKFKIPIIGDIAENMVK